MKTSLTIATPLVAMRIQIAQACGIDTSRVLKRVGLKPATLLNPIARFTLAQDNAVWRELVELTGDPAIGLKLGQYIKLPGLGAIGYLMMNADTIFEGMKFFCKYERLLTNAYRSEIVQNDEAIAYITHCEGDWQPERRYTLDFFMSSVRTLAANMAIDPLAIREIRFQSDRPANLDPYIEVFGSTQLKFGCDDTRFVFARAIAQTRVIGANPDLLTTFHQQAETLLAKYDRDNFSDRVRQKIVQHLQGETPTLKEISTQLHLSSRSLQLKLKQQNTSYQTLLDEVRRDMAIGYLQESHLSITDIAYLVGFSDLSVFSRKFKRWTGQAPSTFQKNTIR